MGIFTGALDELLMSEYVANKFHKSTCTGCPVFEAYWKVHANADVYCKLNKEFVFCPLNGKQIPAYKFFDNHLMSVKVDENGNIKC